MASTSSDCDTKRRRKPLTLNAKLEMIQLSERGMSNTQISRMLGLARQTVSSVVNAKEKFLNEIRNATPVNTKIIRKRDSLIAEMEKYLVIWIEDQTNHNVPLTQRLIRNKALSLFRSMKADKGEEAAEDKFVASLGWFRRFKERSKLYYSKVNGSGGRTTESFPQELANVIEQGGYTKQQIFNINITALYWKNMLSKTYIAEQAKTVLNKKLTLLLGANAAGDLKLKPMLICPKGLEDYAKANLPVIYKSNSKACLTGELFLTWFTDYFKPTVQDYCNEHKLPFKILLLLDNVSTHPNSLVGMYKEINVRFLPPSTTLLLQPMNQVIISTFKLYYMRRTLEMANNYVESDMVSNVAAFWNGFTILDGIKIIRDAWDEVKEQTLQGVWINLIPSLKDHDESFNDLVEEVTASVVHMAQQLELDVKSEDITELLQSHIEEDEEQKIIVCKEEFLPVDSPVTPKDMTIEELEDAIKSIEDGMAAFKRIDPDFERSSSVNAKVANDIDCYKEILREKKQNDLHLFFKEEPSESFEEIATTSLSQLPSLKRMRFAEKSDDENVQI